MALKQMNISPKKILLIIAVALALVAAVCWGFAKKPPHIIINNPPASSSQSSPLRVDKIIDGDTFILSDGRHVRLLGIDTPEIGEPYSDSAKIFADSIVAGKPIRLEYDKANYDSYGRELAYLYIDSICSNVLILRRGFATIYLFKENSRYSSRFIAAQNEARRAKRGIWSLPPPQTEEYYIAAGDSYRFHRPLCPSIKTMNLKNARRFRTRDQALDSGLSPCRRCRP
jgi:micrococcal nuclease